MTRREPLLALALGRSPYTNEAILGEGEPDPRAPRQEYDSGGRPIFPASMRLHRAQVRACNEVLEIAGVVRSERVISQAQIDHVRDHFLAEDRLGQRFIQLGRLMLLGGVWAVNGLRQRLLIFRRYSQVPFISLFDYHRVQQSSWAYFTIGLPTFMINNLLKRSIALFPRFERSNVVNAVTTYVNLHLDIFIFLQRMGLISPSLLPSPRFFLPGGTPLSPIPALPPLPTTLSVLGALKWLGYVALGAVPIVRLLFVKKIVFGTLNYLCQSIIQHLPTPFNQNRRAKSNASARGAGNDDSSPPPVLYRDNRLTTLPSRLATDAYALPLSLTIPAPLEAMAYRDLARRAATWLGISTDDMYDPGEFSWPLVRNYVGLELVHFYVEFGIWLAVSRWSRVFVRDPPRLGEPEDEASEEYNS